MGGEQDQGPGEDGAGVNGASAAGGGGGGRGWAWREAESNPPRRGYFRFRVALRFVIGEFCGDVLVVAAPLSLLNPKP